MKRNAINALTGLFIFVSLGLTGCGGGGGGGTATPSTQGVNLLTSMGWFFDNTAPDFLNNGVTCSLNVDLIYNESIAVDKIESFTVTAPNGWYWTLPPSSGQFGTRSDGKPYFIVRLSDSGNPNTFPLAGNWTAEIKLKNGWTSSVNRAFHEPGSSADATHQFLYTAEDFTPSTNPSQYIASLGRFPSQGFTVQYSEDGGGEITTTGFSAIRSHFLAVELSAYNMWCWLYDANNQYLGVTVTEYSHTDHSDTGLIDAAGELLIKSSSTTSATGSVDLSTVKYIRIVYVDGAQFAPSSYSNMDYRSVSALVTVN